MDEKVTMRKNIWLGLELAGVLLVSGLVIWYSGCDGGFRTRRVEGTATVSGTVQSFFAVNTALGQGSTPSPPVINGVAGVQVMVRGAGMSAETDEQGVFILEGVPAGRQLLVFSHAGQQAELGIYCPPDSAVRLNQLQVQGGARQYLAFSDAFKTSGGSCIVDGVRLHRHGSPGGVYRYEP